MVVGTLAAFQHIFLPFPTVMTMETLQTFPLVEFLTGLLLTGVTPTSAKTVQGTL